MAVVASGKVGKDGNATRLVVLIPNVQGFVYQTFPFIEDFWFLIQERSNDKH